MTFTNTYQDPRRAAAYDKLELGGTYHLVFRDLPDLLRAHVSGLRAVDFGCGTGRSTRFLRELGFAVIGVDVADSMIAHARRRDRGGDYRIIADGDFSRLPQGGFDLVQSAFTFDNVPTRRHKVRLLRGLRRLLAPGGRLVNIVSRPEIYWHEWVTFTTRDFPENRTARRGDVVRIVTTDYPDRRPVEDILCSDADYRAVYRDAELEPVLVARPLGRADDGITWRSETTVAPWAIYLLRRAADAA